MAESLPRTFLCTSSHGQTPGNSCARLSTVFVTSKFVLHGYVSVPHTCKASKASSRLRGYTKFEHDLVIRLTCLDQRLHIVHPAFVLRTMSSRALSDGCCSQTDVKFHSAPLSPVPLVTYVARDATKFVFTRISFSLSLACAAK